VKTAVQLCASSAISNDHWYRFRVTASPDENKYSVRLYDMGITHPTVQSATGALVGLASDLPFLNDLDRGDGISAFNIHAYGMGGVVGEAGVDSGNVLVDNICVTACPGMMIVIQ
jgi:hypothetical protein